MTMAVEPSKIDLNKSNRCHAGHESLTEACDDQIYFARTVRALTLSVTGFCSPVSGSTVTVSTIGRAPGAPRWSTDAKGARSSVPMSSVELWPAT